MSPLTNKSNFNDSNLRAQEQDNANNNNASTNFQLTPNSTLAIQEAHKFFISKKYGENLLTSLTKILRDSRFCDVDIICADKVIHAHRFILSAGSAYFEAMFRPEQNFDETDRRSVTLHSISPEIVVALIEFIYSGKIEINQANVQELLAAADMLQLPDVVEGCCEYLVRELHPSNALGILRFAETHHCTLLEESAQQFINTNFAQIANEDELLEMPHHFLIKLISSELVRVDSECQVFNAALRWIKHDVLHRRQFVFEILSHVRLALVPVRIIDAAIINCQNVSLKVALRSVRKDLTSKRGMLTRLNAAPRIFAKKSIYIIGGSRRETSTGWAPADCIFESVVKFDIFRREWIETAPMQIGRILPGVATVGGKIYVVGGERGSQILANGEVYDPQMNTWEPVAPMIIPRCEFGLCAVGGTLFAIGGWIGEDIGGSMESYDPVKDTWSMIGNLPEPRFSMGVVSFEGLIFIVGGCTTSSRHLPDLVSYNPVTREWTPHEAKMETARCQMGVAVLDRYLYVVGGNNVHQDVLNTVEKYSFDEDKWTTCAPMNVGRASPAVASADGLLYVAGGDQTCEVNFYRAQITVSAFECYDPATDTWKSCPDLPMSRSEAGAVVV